MATASELVTKISFVGSLAPLDKLNTGLTTSIKTISAVGVAYGAMGLALNSWVDSTLEGIYQTSNFSKELGVSIEAMQEWGYIAKMNGSSAEAVQGSMSSLSEKMGEFAKFDSGKGKEVFEKLGIAVKDSEGKIKSADLVMRDLANSMQGMSASEQRSIIAKLGIDESMLQTLRLTNDQFEHLRDRAGKLGIVTEQEAKQIEKYKQSLVDVGHGLEYIKTKLAIAFTPALTEASEGFTNLLADNKELISNGLNKTVDILMSFGRALVNTGKLIYNMIDNTIGFENALMILGAAVLYVNRAMLLNPIGLVTGAIILAIAVVDDLVVAFEGGESVIADFFASFNVDIVKTLTGAFKILDGTLDGVIAKLLSAYEGYVKLSVFTEKAGNFLGFNFGKTQEERLKLVTEKKEKYLKSSKDKISSALNDGVKVDDSLGIGQEKGSSNPDNYNDTGNVHPAPVPLKKIEKDNNVEKVVFHEVKKDTKDTEGPLLVDSTNNKKENDYAPVNDYSKKEGVYAQPLNTIIEKEKETIINQVPVVLDIPKLNEKSHLPSNITNSNVTTNNNTQNNHIKIEVKADNPQQTVQAIKDSLTPQVTDASKQFNTWDR